VNGTRVRELCNKYRLIVNKVPIVHYFASKVFQNLSKMPFQLISYQYSGNRLTYDQLFGVLFLSPILRTFDLLLFILSLQVALEDLPLWSMLWFFLSFCFWFIQLQVALSVEVIIANLRLGDTQNPATYSAFVAFLTVLIMIKCGGYLRLIERFLTDTKRMMKFAVIIYVICVLCSIIGHLFKSIYLFNYINYK
jgi:hypothetical protein